MSELLKKTFYNVEFFSGSEYFEADVIVEIPHGDMLLMDYQILKIRNDVGNVVDETLTLRNCLQESVNEVACDMLLDIL